MPVVVGVGWRCRTEEYLHCCTVAIFFWGEARNDLARIQDISIWPLLVAWPAGTLLGLSVAFF